MGVAAAIAGVATVVGAGTSIYASSKASKATKKAADSSAAIQQYMYDTTRADQAPWRQAGSAALTKLSSLYGLSTGTGTSSGASGTDSTYGGFTTSPGYQFRIDEATKAIERSAAARGALASGATMKSINNSVQGVASDEYGNYVNGLMSIAGLGQTATSGTASAGTSAANSISNAYTNAGDATASGYIKTGQAISGGISNLASSYLYGKGWGSSGGTMGSATSWPTGIY